MCRRIWRPRCRGRARWATRDIPVDPHMGPNRVSAAEAPGVQDSASAGGGRWFDYDRKGERSIAGQGYTLPGPEQPGWERLGRAQLAGRARWCTVRSKSRLGNSAHTDCTRPPGHKSCGSCSPRRLSSKWLQPLQRAAFSYRFLERRIAVARGRNCGSSNCTSHPVMCKFTAWIFFQRAL
jgi:hypothetical protein